MTTAADSPRTSHSLINRITSPFKSKTRNVSDFHIQTAEPHRQYAPGDIVKGSVFLTIHKPVRVTHIVVCLHGYVKVYKNAIAPGDGTARDGGFSRTGPGKRGTEYLGNGFISLFEDEVVLCGDGRLGIGLYTFRFELEFPPSGLPSSIDFERGTISYIITSTMTRPTTIAPTTIFERKIHLVDSVDIASIRKPKPRVITLEPIPRKSKTRSTTKKGPSPLNTMNSIKINEPIGGQLPASHTAAISRNSDEPPRSPVPSEISSASAASSSNVSFRLATASGTGKNSKASDVRSISTSIVDKTIIATTELFRGGYLPGDNIPVKVWIDHTKPVKSLQGIIVTLYRLGRIDTFPVLPVGDSQKTEDFLPRSLTGLGGLSLSTAGSSHVYRMDLAQSFAPLIIDPTTLSATINTSVRIPDDVFPSITNVPGAMISFTYCVEVIIDLGGKLAAQDRFLPHFNMTSSPTPFTSKGLSSAWRGIGAPENPQFQCTDFVDTDQIRREKSVVACVFEVVMGTKDSARKAAKKAPEADNLDSDVNQFSVNAESPEYSNGPFPVEIVHDSEELNYDNQYHDHYYDFHEQRLTDAGDLQSPPLIPPPEMNEELDEKAQIRRAEERLLPSSPPIEGGSSSSPVPTTEPTAPSFNLLNVTHQDGFMPSPAYAGPWAPSHYAREEGQSSNSEDVSVSIDDKQELERQRLMAAASAPDDDLYGETTGPSGSVPLNLTPSAPMLNDEHYWSNNNSDIHEGSSGPEHLPRYQK
ncbi:MAG: ph-response sensor protein [Icmadophila ericetorum]|nr:ph-response sensor protein [Icmadophila ericetorum]